MAERFAFYLFALVTFVSLVFLLGAVSAALGWRVDTTIIFIVGTATAVLYGWVVRQNRVSVRKLNNEDK